MHTIDHIIDEIIETEGGFVNDEDDAGGATKFGITKATLSAWRGHPVTDRDVELLERPEAVEIYMDWWVKKPRFNDIVDYKLMLLVVDAAVHSGQSRAAKWLQTVAGVTADGVIGPVTLRTVNAMDPTYLRKRFLAERLKFIGKLITVKPSQSKFAAGWSNRLANLMVECL